MKLGELLIILFFFGAILGLIVFYFNDYLFAKAVGPYTHTTDVKGGQALRIETGKSTALINIRLCGEGGDGNSCFPLATNAEGNPVRIRIPIGYPAGNAILKITQPSQGSIDGISYSVELHIR